MSGKRYPEEFKTEAVKQVVDRGYSVSSVATRLDICCGQLKLATALEFFQYRFSDSFGGNPPLYSCGLSAL